MVTMWYIRILLLLASHLSFYLQVRQRERCFNIFHYYKFVCVRVYACVRYLFCLVSVYQSNIFIFLAVSFDLFNCLFIRSFARLFLPLLRSILQLNVSYSPVCFFLFAPYISSGFFKDFQLLVSLKAGVHTPHFKK